MNGLLYCPVVVIWGTTWIAIYLQQGPVAAPVSIFWRFAIASTVMIAILLISGKLRKLSGRDHLFCLLQGGCVFALTSGVLHCRCVDQYRSRIRHFLDGGPVQCG